MWIEKYRPSNLEGIIGNRTAVEAIRTFNWKKPMLIHGGLGIGKTTLVNAIATEMNFEVVEVDNDNIEQASSIASTSSLYGGRKLVLIENVEDISDMKKVVGFLETTKCPTVLTTSDAKSKKLKTIKTMCFDVQLRRPQAATIANYLEVICKKEGIKSGKDVLMKIAENSRGDLRIALTDLETIAKGRQTVKENDLDVLYSRDVEVDIYKTLSVIFGGEDISEVVESTWSLDEEPRNTIFWIEENVPTVIHEPGPLSKAFHFLSRADMFLGRIMRRQYWGFLRYANALMTAGVNTSKEKTTYAMYKFPSYFASLGRSKGERNAAVKTAGKLKARIHSSNNTIIREDVPLLRLLLKKNKVDEETLKKEYTLSDEELAYIKGS
ncbi:MAG: AAA family ATPase [Candidatus Altiarchaeota archaeon]